MPFVYTPEARQRAIQAVLDGLAAGTPLAVICRAEGMPCDDTVRDWAASDEELARGIARAREKGFDQIALEALEIIDEEPEFAITAEGRRRDAAYVAWQKARFEARLKLLAKWDPKRYGDAMLHKHADADGEKIKMDDTAKLTRLASLVSAITKASDESPDDAG